MLRIRSGYIHFPALNSQDAVTELYVFHRHYLETHPLEQAGRKAVDVEGKLKETLSLLDSVQGLIQSVTLSASFVYNIYTH